MDAMEWVVRTANALGIDCDIERRAAFTYGTEQAEIDPIRAEVDAAREAGLPATFVTQTGLPVEISGAIRVDDQVQFHPRRFLLGLAEDFVRAGGRIVEQTRVVDLAVHSHGVRTADGHTITASEVVVTTQFPIIDRLKVFTRMTPRREFVVAAPLPLERDPDGMYITPAGYSFGPDGSVPGWAAAAHRDRRAYASRRRLGRRPPAATDCLDPGSVSGRCDRLPVGRSGQRHHGRSALCRPS